METRFCEYLRENEKFYETVYACSNGAQLSFENLILLSLEAIPLSWSHACNKIDHGVL